MRYKGMKNKSFIGIDISKNEIVQKILVQEMMHAADLAVPLLVDANVGDSWYDAK